MDLYEYQARDTFEKYGVPVLAGIVADTPEEVKAAAEKIGGVVVVKAQVKTGGRGKAGGVKVAKTPDEAYEAAKAILGLDIKGHVVKRVMVAAGAKIAREFYFSVLLDRSNRSYLSLASVEGGMEIEELAVERPDALARVEVDPIDQGLVHSVAARAPWEDARPAVTGAVLVDEFVLDLDPPEITPAVRDYAAAVFTPGRPLVDAIIDLTSRIFSDFTYRSGSTAISTRVDTVLERRMGVCQDFARVAIACLRSVGLAARYESGYLATDPPPGTERIFGADASHAWAAVWLPGDRWLAFDPTNNKLVDERHVTVAWGRDYDDVPPLRGVIYTDASKSEIEVSVDVSPLSEVIT